MAPSGAVNWFAGAVRDLQKTVQLLQVEIKDLKNMIASDQPLEPVRKVVRLADALAREELVDMNLKNNKLPNDYAAEGDDKVGPDKQESQMSPNQEVQSKGVLKTKTNAKSCHDSSKKIDEICLDNARTIDEMNLDDFSMLKNNMDKEKLSRQQFNVDAPEFVPNTICDVQIDNADTVGNDEYSDEDIAFVEDITGPTGVYWNELLPHIQRLPESDVGELPWIELHQVVTCRARSMIRGQVNKYVSTTGELRQLLATAASSTMLLEWENCGPLRQLYACSDPGTWDVHLTAMATRVVERYSAFVLAGCSNLDESVAATATLGAVAVATPADDVNDYKAENIRLFKELMRMKVEMSALADEVSRTNCAELMAALMQRKARQQLEFDELEKSIFSLNPAMVGMMDDHLSETLQDGVEASKSSSVKGAQAKAKKKSKKSKIATSDNGSKAVAYKDVALKNSMLSRMQ